MKHIALYILFLLSIVVSVNTTREANRVTAAVCTESLTETGATDHECVMATVIANSVADISLQQNNNFNGGCSFKWSRAVHSFWEKGNARIPASGSLAIVDSYKIILYNYRNYFAEQKISGYYLYTLCKIII